MKPNCTQVDRWIRHTNQKAQEEASQAWRDETMPKGSSEFAKRGAGASQIWRFGLVQNYSEILKRLKRLRKAISVY